MAVRDNGHNLNTQDPGIGDEPLPDWEFWTVHFPWDPAEEDGGWAPNPEPVP
jgi:hypothetical protein